METIVEICAGSYTDCLTAWENGAKRVELNSALSVGGLTPSLATLRKVKEKTGLTVICMVRPRPAGFCYDYNDTEIMMEDARLLLENGADGIAFGFLNEDKTIHIENTKAMVHLIHSYGKCAIFHRAFDITPNPDVAIRALIKCGVDRLLTSGQKKTALEGLELITHLQSTYKAQIEILPGSGITSENAPRIIQSSGVFQVHSSCKSYQSDTITIGENVSFTYLDAPHEADYNIVNPKIVKELIAATGSIFQK